MAAVEIFDALEVTSREAHKHVDIVANVVHGDIGEWTERLMSSEV
jgi:hypothetical protein